jgi:uncharacterized membrane protein YeaQ/YmgE (transglycosylase-associated protein family)
MELLTLVGTGLVAGILATKLAKSTSHGVVIDTIIGSFGVVVGPALFALAGLSPHSWLMTTIVGVVSGIAIHALANYLPKKTLF